MLAHEQPFFICTGQAVGKDNDRLLLVSRYLVLATLSAHDLHNLGVSLGPGFRATMVQGACCLVPSQLRDLHRGVLSFMSTYAAHRIPLHGNDFA